MVGSSVIAAWSDISTTLTRMSAGVAVVDPTSGADVPLPAGMMGGFNMGYAWMLINCIASACYVRPSVIIACFSLISGPLHAQAHQGHRLQGLGLDVLQQPPVHSCPAHLLAPCRGLGKRLVCP